jgi:UDP-N-acetylmuramate dehydrogenase
VISFLKDVALAPKTTLGVGGAARFFVDLNGDASAVSAALTLARERGLPVLVLGGGSNVVIHDSGWHGLVITLGASASPQINTDETVTFSAGQSWDAAVTWAVENNYSGIECLAGIPGMVGSTPIQNVGAYGQEVKDTIVSVLALDQTTLELRKFTNAECDFGYRKSRFNSTEIGRWIVLDVAFRLEKNGAPMLKYADLKNYFDEKSIPTLTEVAAAVRAIRAAKGMVLDVADPNSRSAGSFFKNPILTQSEIPTDAPRYPQTDESVKTSAAWLIETSGFVKGQRLVGGVGLSAKHLLALVNQNNATASEIAASARLVQAGVLERFGILLHPEPVFVGDWVASELPDGALIFKP